MSGRTGVVCENCGRQAPNGGKYCGQCGTLLPSTSDTGGARSAPATAHVPLDVFETGRYPDGWRVCVATGEPAEGLRQIRADKPPVWIWFLLLLGIVPFLLVRLIVYRPVRGWVPVSDRAEAEEAQKKEQRWHLAMVIGVVAVALGLFLFLRWYPETIVTPVRLALVAFVILIGVIPLGLSQRRTMRPRHRTSCKMRATVLANQTLVEIRNVHPAFASAVAAGTDPATLRAGAGSMPPPAGQRPPPGWWWDGMRWQPPGQVGGDPH